MHVTRASSPLWLLSILNYACQSCSIPCPGNLCVAQAGRHCEARCVLMRGVVFLCAGKADDEYKSFLAELGGGPPPGSGGHQSDFRGGSGGGGGRGRPGDDLPDNCKLYVGNLSSAVTDSVLKSLMEPFGTVLHAVVLLDMTTGGHLSSLHPALQFLCHFQHPSHAPAHACEAARRRACAEFARWMGTLSA